MIGWNNQDAVWAITVCIIVGTILLCWGIPRWTGLDLGKTNMKLERLVDDEKNAIKFWIWTVLLIIGVVGGLWLLWHGAAWLIAQFVGTVQSYR
jgi:hypothetical protein